MTETARPRANRDGDPCPPWCDRDHDDGSLAAEAHIRQTGSIGFGDGGLDSIWACALLAGYHDGRPVIGITGHRYQGHGSPQVDLPAHRAEGLAGLLDMLADATPEQHRGLAEAVRQAAAQVTGGAQS